MHDEFKAWAERAPHSLAVSLCSARTSPPLGHNKGYVNKNLLPQPSQSAGKFKDTISYRRRRFSWNYFIENSILLRRWVISISHDPLSVSLQRGLNTYLSACSFLLVSTSIYKYSRYFHLSALDLCTEALCDT